MEIDNITAAWLISGVLLLLSEVVIPGAVVGILGVSAILIGLALGVGLVEGIINSFTTWFIISLTMTLLFRGVLSMFFKTGSHIEVQDDDLDAFGEIVEVVEEISANHMRGRIRFRGTTWPAMSGSETFKKGEKVEILERVDLVWLVQACPKERNAGMPVVRQSDHAQQIAGMPVVRQSDHTQ